jgi:hypothetical protein
VVPSLSLEQSELVLKGESKQHFLEFIRSMLRWQPAQRKGAAELLRDPWLEDAVD